MTGRIHRGVLVVLALAGLSLATANAPGEAQASIEAGWWWKGNPGATLPLPSPVPNVGLPQAPPALPPPPNANGGLMVAAAPDGAFAVAAVKAVVKAESLKLDVVENGDVGGANAHLLACAINGDWTPESAGRWDAKPVVACDLSNAGGSVAGIREGDGSWVFPVQPLVEDGMVDVVIVPAAGSLPGGLLEPFQIVFRVPTIESFVVSPGADLGVGEEAEAFVPPPEDVDAQEEFTAELDGFDPTSVVGDGSFAPVAAPALPRAEQAPQVIAPVRATAGPSGSGAQTLAVLILLLLAAFAWLVSQQVVPLPASLTRIAARPRPGAAAPPTSGGLGQFRRTRSGKPPSLF